MEKDNNFYVFLFLVTEAVASDYISLGPKLSIEESESFGFFFWLFITEDTRSRANNFRRPHQSMRYEENY